MSASNKPNNGSKRFAASKTNDFVTKARVNEQSRASALTKGWTNLGKPSARRIPPPANVPSLKNEIGTNSNSIDPIIPTSGASHGWTTNTNQTPTSSTSNSSAANKQPSQQQLDAQPTSSTISVSSSLNAPSNVNELDRFRSNSSWSNVTAGSSQDQTPNFGLKDFPRLTAQEKSSTKSSTENSNNSSSTNATTPTTSTTTQGPVFRPANLSSWKEGGGRIQPSSTETNKDSSDNSHSTSSMSIPTSNVSNLNSSNFHTQTAQPSNNHNTSYQRPYQNQQQSSNQMWNNNVGNPYNTHNSNQPLSSSRHQTRGSSYGNHSNQFQSSRTQNTTNEYKTPKILKNKDIDELSKLTDNVTWTRASQEVNYDERIRFSDDEDNDTIDHKSRQYQAQGQSKTSTGPVRSSQPNYSQTSSRSRLMQEDAHVKQLQDHKSSEMINTLNVAKQRRDEQERQLRPKTYDDSSSQRNSSSRYSNENKSTSNNRNRAESTDNQTFAMKSWSDQMDSFNYASLHEKSITQNETDDQTDETSRTKSNQFSKTSNKYSRSRSQSSSQSQPDQDVSTNYSKPLSVAPHKQTKTISGSSSSNKQTTDAIDYFENTGDVQSSVNSNDQWNEWEETTKSSIEFVSTDQRYQSFYNNESRRLPTNPSDDSTQNSESNLENTRTKSTNKTRTTNVPRPVETLSTKSNNNKPQSAWRSLSPTGTGPSNDPTPQEAIYYNTQTKSAENNSGNPTTDRRQTTTNERRTRYSNLASTINTASIPPLMSVRSEVPPPSTSVNSKHYKNANNLHYSQRNEFYNDTNDSAWGNDDEYYDDDNGYYDGTMNNRTHHQSSMVYHSHTHTRGYTALGPYGRYRRGGLARHQQQYSGFSSSNTVSSQSNAGLPSKSKKTTVQRTATLKKDIDQTEPTTTESETKVEEQQTIKKPAPWAAENKAKAMPEETVATKPIDDATKPEVEENKEKPVVSNDVTPLLEIDTEANLATMQQSDQNESSVTAGKKGTANAANKNNQDHRQQGARHRTTYERSGQDYDSMPVNSHTYYGNSRRGARGHDSSNSYYYPHSQQHYHNQYNYSADMYHPTRGTNKTTKRGGLTKTGGRHPTKSATSTGSNSNTKAVHVRHHSTSENDQKEGEEWETASESSTNMRNGQSENTSNTASHGSKSTKNEMKPSNQDRTTPKKSFSSQRPSSNRQTENSSVHRRGHTLHERGSKTGRISTHRSAHLSSNVKQASIEKSETEAKPVAAVKKETIRHSLDGYDLNNVAGVVKIETLPAGALEEEGSDFDNGGDDFCLVMSKRDRKEQKAAQLSKQNAIESNQQSSSTNVDLSNKTTTVQSHVTETEDQATNEKLSSDATNQRTRNGKPAAQKAPGKSTNSNSRQHNKNEHQNASMYYYDQNSYYYYSQNQYYDHDSYYNYGNYNNSHRQPSSRRKQRQSQTAETTTNETISNERKHEQNTSEKSSALPANVMSHIDMWDPHTEGTLSNNAKKPIEKPTHDRKFNNELVGSSNETSLGLPQRPTVEMTRHSPNSKTGENLGRTIKPPSNDGKADRDEKKKPTNFTEGDNMTSLGEGRLFEKTFLDYDDKQSIVPTTDDYNQKINSLKMIWEDRSETPGAQLEQTIKSMVAMQQQQHQQETAVSTTTSVKKDTYVKETIAVTSTTISTQNNNITAVTNEETTKKTITSAVTPTAMNQSTIYAANPAQNKNEQKNVCTVKPTQQVPPNIQDQADVNAYSSFAAPTIPAALSQVQMPPPPPQQQPQQHLLPQAPMNPVHQTHSYSFYENILPPMAQQPQQQFNRMYSSNSNTNNSDPSSSEFSNPQSSQIYPHNFPYQNANVFMHPQPSMHNTNQMFHPTSQGSMTGTPQTSGLPMQPPMPNYPATVMMDPVQHMLGQPQGSRPPLGPYMSNPMMAGRSQGGNFYQASGQPQLPTPPGTSYRPQDTLPHGGFYPPFLPPPNTNPPPSMPHNMYGPGENYHHASQPIFPRGGSIDRADHALMSQSYGRPPNYHSASSNQAAQQNVQQGAPLPLLPTTSKAFSANPHTNSSNNHTQFYQTALPPQTQPHQYGRHSMTINQAGKNNVRQPTQTPPGLMSNIPKGMSNNGNNGHQLHQHQSLTRSQTANIRSTYHQPSYTPYPTSTGPNDDSMKPKHI